MITRSADWRPGDPLYPRGQYRDYLFNFRDDVDHVCATDQCAGIDAASWPVPSGGHALPEVDEITVEVLRLRRAAAAEVSV